MQSIGDMILDGLTAFIPLLLLVGIFYFFLRKKTGRGPVDNSHKLSKQEPLGRKSQEISTQPVESFSGRGTYYVDLSNLTCTCPDFKKRRFQFHIQDPRRLCKHLLANTDEFSLFDMEIANEIFYVDTNKGFPIIDRYRKDIDGTSVIIHIPPKRDRPWVNIYIEQERYGFNVEERRWAHGQDPMESEALESWIVRMYRQPTELSDRII